MDEQTKEDVTNQIKEIERAIAEIRTTTEFLVKDMKTLKNFLNL